MKKKARVIYIVEQRDVRSSLGVGPPGLGPLYVGQALKDAGYRVRILYPAGNREQRWKTIERAVATEEPLFIGFSTVISGLLSHVIDQSISLKKRGITVVWGGAFASAVPQVSLKENYVDYVVLGEGERPTVQLADALYDEAIPKEVPGVGYREDNEIIINEPMNPVSNLDEYGIGLDLVNWQEHLPRNSSGEFSSAFLPFSRGCPFQCAFCYNTIDPYRQQWRTHSAEYLQKIISFFKVKYGVSRFHIIADNVFGKITIAKKILDELNDITWAAGIPLACITPDFLLWAQRNRCIGLDVGLESGSNQVLKAMKKPHNVDMIRDRMELCAQNGIPTRSSWMALLPGETAQDRKSTFSLMDEVYKMNSRNILKFHIYRAYPGTAYWDQCIKLGFVPPCTLEEWANYRAEIYTLLGYEENTVKDLWSITAKLYLRGTSYHIQSKSLRSAMKKKLFSIL